MIIFLSPLMFVFWTILQMTLLVLSWTLGLYLKFPKTMLSLTVVGLIVGGWYTHTHKPAPLAATSVVEPQQSRVLYDMDRVSMSSKLSPGWSFRQGVLSNDGTGGWQFVPYAPGRHGVADYAVEAQIQIPNAGSDHQWVYLVVRSQGNSAYSADFLWDQFENKWYGEVGYLGSTYTALAHIPGYGFSPGRGWHSLRFEVQGNFLRMLVDGQDWADAQDSRLSSGGSVAIYTDNTRIDIRSLQVVSLSSGSS